MALKDIVFSEFHDIRPGSAAPSAERDSVQLLAHAREILRSRQFRALHSLISRDPDAVKGEAPVFVANPHGFTVKTQVEFEVQLNCNAWAISDPEVRLRHLGRDYPRQRLLAEANSAGNWPLRLATAVDLQLWEIARFDEYCLNDRP